MGDRWISDYEACARLAQEIMEQLHHRNQDQKGSSAYVKNSAQIRGKIRTFAGDLGSLRQQLIRSPKQYHITQREIERRQQLLDQLCMKEKQLNASFRNDDGSSSARSALYDESMNPFGEPESAPWGGTRNLDDMENMGFGEVQDQQQQIIAEQDQGLEALSQVMARQKQMALDIGNEVEGQNELLDDIVDSVDRTDQRLLKETRHIKIVDRKSNTCGYLVVIAILFIAILVIVVVPYGGKA